MPHAPSPTAKPVWRGRFLEMHVVPWGDGGVWEYARRVSGISAAVILAITDAGEVLLVEQYRPALGTSCIELPAGLIGDAEDGHGADPLAAAARELVEETGHAADQWEAFGTFASSPGMIGEVFHFFRATGLRRVGPGGGVGAEEIRLHTVPIADIPAFIASARARGVAIDTRLLIGLRLLDL